MNDDGSFPAALDGLQTYASVQMFSVGALLKYLVFQF
jgi:hypothetical protein